MTFKTPFSGYHHVTSSVTHAQQDVDFHSKTLGLRLIKRTVLLDGDVPFYHLYYGNGSGEEGTLLTCFVLRHRPEGRLGSGQLTSIALTVAEDSLDFWENRLSEFDVPNHRLQRFGSKRIRFSHPDGIVYEMVGVRGCERKRSWENSPVPADTAIQGIHSVTVSSREMAEFESFMVSAMGLRFAGRQGSESRYIIEEDVPGRIVEVAHTPDLPQGTWGYERNTIDHVAFAIADLAAQEKFKLHLESMGFIDTSEPKDRNYFSSVYFRTPAGAMFEAAWTHENGFLKDETKTQLGTALQLPAVLGRQHDEVMAHLEPITA